MIRIENCVPGHENSTQAERNSWKKLVKQIGENPPDEFDTIIDFNPCFETSQHLKAHRVDDLKIRDNDSVTIAPSYFFLLIVILNLEINRNIENLFPNKKHGYIG